MNPRTTIATLLAGSIAGAALAVPGDYVLDCNYSIGSIQTGYVPDFDQLRDQGPFMFDGENWYYDPPGLPSGGNPIGGWNYCVPTAAANWLGWIANHGHPDVMPTGAPANWQSADQYDSATWTISELGIRMGTNPAPGGGTSYDGFKDGLADWFDEKVGPNFFDMGSEGPSGSTVPSLAEMAAHGLAGDLVVVTIGWYIEQSPGKWQRDSGHVVSLTGAFDYCSTSSARIRFRDPASDYITDDYFDQSTFTNETYDLEYVMAEFSTSDPPVWHERTHGRVVGYGSTYPLGERVPFLEAYAYISPVQGLGIGPSGTLTLYNPFDFDPNNDNIDDLGVWIPNTFAVDPNQNDVYYTLGTPNDVSLWRYDLLERESEPTGIDLPPDVIQIELGRDGRLYTLSPNLACCWDLSSDPPTVVCATLPFPADVMAFNDLTDELIVISRTGHTGFRFFVDAFGVPMLFDFPLPEGLVLEVRPQVAIGPDDGAIWLTSESDRTATKYVLGPNGLTEMLNLTDPALIGATSFDVGDDNTVFIVVVGLIVVYTLDPQVGWEQQPAGDGFAGMPASGHFALVDAHWQIDDDVPLGPHGLPDQFAPQVPDVCLGDFNGDGLIGVPDLLVLLAAWGPNPGHGADLNGDDVIDALDLLLMLAGWGGCAP